MGIYGDDKNRIIRAGWDTRWCDGFTQSCERHPPVCVAGSGVDDRVDFIAETVKIEEEVIL